MRRKQFLQMSTMAVGGLIISKPSIAAGTQLEKIIDSTLGNATKKQLADVALNSAKKTGAEYADIRISRKLTQQVSTRENKVQGVTNSSSYGAGIRVLYNGCWGFAASDLVTKENIAALTAKAISVAKANLAIQGKPVQLASQKGFGEKSWKTPISINPFNVPVKEKIDLLLSANAIALKGGANFVNSSIVAVNEQKYFASTDGSYIDQDIHRIFPMFTVTKVDSGSGKFDTRRSICAPVGMGYEYLTPSASEKIPGIVPRYRNRYDLLEDIRIATENVNEKIKAPSVVPGKYDLVLDPSHLWLTIHESVGHPTELDRVLGYEANYAGTSFLTLDKWESGNFRFGNEHVNFFADRIQPGSLAAAGWDDEGVKCKEWDLIKKGILVNYQATRDQAHIIGEKEGQGCSYAESWSKVQFQRMPNVSLRPAEIDKRVEEIISNIENGIYIIGDGSFSIDQQRYNFQFGGQLFYEIKNGRITGMLRDVAYQANTREFWNSLNDLAGKSDYRLGGAFNDGKGQPSQLNAVSHGCSTARFNNVNVINTSKKIQ